MKRKKKIKINTNRERIEFLHDAEPEWHKETREGLLLRPFEVRKVPAFV
jgi:hypothetical protein